MGKTFGCLNTGKSKCNRVFLVCSRKSEEAGSVRPEKVRIEWRVMRSERIIKAPDIRGFLQILHTNLALL